MDAKGVTKEQEQSDVILIHTDAVEMSQEIAEEEKEIQVLALTWGAEVELASYFCDEQFQDPKIWLMGAPGGWERGTKAGQFHFNNLNRGGADYVGGRELVMLVAK
uniref:Uncharacterized protein n=1 Tax=Romanomermis culicivorax TaxID=13658 RepID=A0A915KFC1_ROMCU